ncbi:hypothetical protein Q75_17030 [Bacillus coahuilensis p1.1.43]|uniref:Aminoglycoside phosphotransferase domain-containing protein n=1 Tax=Bacillus coahuilensis p1.1.43 TaxID=1150625 RepID=A0A147K3Z1_9BACI|nr:aminoglycoside phosphotransferase family protein [Bacillus coahuilensis]KUP04018.1 hypothetical protein Q75_17030 [Bacillus coahuilensis p1.1.43]
MKNWTEFEEKKQDRGWWEQKVQEVLRIEHLTWSSIEKFSTGTMMVYSIDRRVVVKLFPLFEREIYRSEVDVLLNLHKDSLPVSIPTLIGSGELEEELLYIVMSQLRGELLLDCWDDLSQNEKAQVAEDLGDLISKVHAQPGEDFKHVPSEFDSFCLRRLENIKEYHRNTGLRAHLIEQIPAFLGDFTVDSKENWRLLTGEYTPFNLMMTDSNGFRELSGLIDFADCFLGDRLYDLLGPIVFNLNQEEGLTKRFLLSYGFHEKELGVALQHQLLRYLLLHQYADIPSYLRALGVKDEVQSLQELSTIVFPL